LPWKESEFEDWFKQKQLLPDGEPILVISRQRSLHHGVDLLALDATGGLVIIEVKNETSTRAAIGQSLEYLAQYTHTAVDDLDDDYSRLKGTTSNLAADFADRFKKKLAVTLRRRVFLVAPSFDFHSTVCVCYLGEQLLGGKVEYGLIRAWREGEGFTITHQKCPSIRPSQELQLHEFAVTPGRRLYCVLEPGSKAVVWYIGKRSEKGLRLANGRALTRKTLQVVSRALMPEGPAKEVDVSQSGTLWQHRKKPATRARLVGQLLTGQSGRRRVAVIARFVDDQFAKFQRTSWSAFVARWRKIETEMPDWRRIEAEARPSWSR